MHQTSAIPIQLERQLDVHGIVRPALCEQKAITVVHCSLLKSAPAHPQSLPLRPRCLDIRHSPTAFLSRIARCNPKLTAAPRGNRTSADATNEDD